MKWSAPELLPAPKRGRYDRGLAREVRQAEQRERLVAALAFVSGAGHELSVATVVARAGMGRSTFYEYFDDIAHALAEVSARAQRDFLARAELELALVLTPLERVRALARAWASELLENPHVMRIGLAASAPTRDVAQLSSVGRTLVELLEREAPARAALPGLADPLRLVAVAAVSDVLGRSYLAQPETPPVPIQRVLSELFLRLLR